MGVTCVRDVVVCVCCIALVWGVKVCGVGGELMLCVRVMCMRLRVGSCVVVYALFCYECAVGCVCVRCCIRV